MTRGTRLAMALIVALALAAGGFLSLRGGGAGKRSDTVRVGFSMGTLKEERWLRDRDILTAKLVERGAEVIVRNANNSDDDQYGQVRELLDEGIDVLVIVPNDRRAASRAVRLAHSRGVRVLSYDRLVADAGVDAYISFDNAAVGRIMAEYLAKRVPKGNYLIVNGPDSDPNTGMIRDGYLSVLKAPGAKGIRVVGDEKAPDWSDSYAYRITDELLSKGFRIDGVIAGDDALAGGVIRALSEHRAAGGTLVVGQDADLAACQRLVEGTQAMTVYKRIPELASMAADAAMTLAKGGRPATDKRISDGTHEVPYIRLVPVAVDKGNLDATVIADGFHASGDVYINTGLGG